MSRRLERAPIPPGVSVILVSGYRDAVEHLQSRYVEVCNAAGMPALPGMFDTDRVYELLQELLELNELMIMMSSDLCQGVLIGRLQALILDEEYRKSLPEDEDDYV